MARLLQQRRIHHRVQDEAQRSHAHGVGLTRRKYGQRIVPKPHAWFAQGQHEPGHKRACLRNVLPEHCQMLVRPCTAPAGHAGSERSTIQGAGTAAADGADVDTFLFQQAVEHTPGKGTLSTPTL